MSYVNKKIRVFKEAGDIEIHRKRSDGRMKTYQSATDARAWCDNTEERRQHILDLIRQGDGKGLSLGKYIPIEAIIDILLSNKNADIKRLQKEIEELKKFIKDNGLHYEEKPVTVIEPVRGSDEREGGRPGEEGGVRYDAEGRPISGSGAPGQAGAGGPGQAGAGGPGQAEARGPGEEAEGKRLGADGEDEAGLGAGTGEVEEALAIRKKISPGETRPGEGSTTGDATTPGYGGTDSSDYDTTTDKSGRYSGRPISEDEKAAAALLAGKSPEDQLLALKQALADTEATYNTQQSLAVEAIEKLENIKDIVDGGDGRRKSTARSLPPVQKLASGGGARRDSRSYDDTFGSCKDEIDALEREIDTMKSTSSPESDIVQREVQVLKKYCAQLAAIQKENADLKRERDMLKDGLASTADDALKDKLMKLDEVTQERDRLRARVQQLEQELANYGNLPQQVDNFKEKSQVLDNLRDDEKDLRRRLDALAGLEDEVRALRQKADKCVESAGDSSDRDKLLARIAELEGELDNCKCKLKELEILKVERNCLKMRVDDLARIQQDYEDLLKKTQGFDACKAECAMYKAKYEELKNLENECNELRAKVQRCEELEKERQLLMKEIEDCECCMNNQEDEIKRLACHIDCLTQDLDKRQDQMKVKVLTMRAHIEKKDCVIAKSEQQLADVQDQLRSSIEQLSCETTCLRNRIDELETDASEFELKVAEKDNQYKALEESYRVLEETKKILEQNKKQLEENNKALMDSLENEKCNKEKLQEALKKAIKSDEHLKQMLKQAKCAIKCITQKLEKHDIIEVGRLETERENYLKKIKELEEGITEQPCGTDRIAELEEELMKAHATIKGLRENLDQLKGVIDENDALRKLAGQLQETAKTQVTKLEDTNENLSRKSQEVSEKCDDLRQLLGEKEQLLGDLNKEMAGLRQQLATEKKLREDAENELTALSASGDVDAAELAKMRGQMNVLNAEIDRLNFDLENQKKECEETIKHLRTKMEQLENDAERIRKLEDQNTDVSTDADRYRKESQLLKDELDKLRNDLDKCRRESDGLGTELEKLKADYERCKKENQASASELKEELERCKKENEILKGELEKQRGKRDKSDSEMDKLKDQLAAKNTLEGENKDLKDEVNKLKQDVAAKGALEKENKDLKDEINRLKQELAGKGGVENENKDLKDEINRLKQDSASAKGTIDKENKDLKDELSKLKDEISKLKDEANKAKQDLAAKEKEKGAFANEKGALEIEKGALEKENKNLKDELNKLKQELAAKGSLEKEKGSLEQMKNAMEKEKNAIEKENKDLKDQVNKLKQDLAAKEKENKELKDEINKLKQEIDALKKEIAGLKQELGSKGGLESDKNKLQDEIDKLKKEVAAKSAPKDDGKENAFAKERDNLLNQIAAQKKEIADLLDKIKQPTKTEDDTTFKELENKNKENEKLRSTIADLEKQLKDLQKAKLDVPKGSPEIDKAVDDLKKSLEKEEKKARDMEENNENLKKKNSELENSLKKCQETNEELKKKIAQLEGEIAQLKKEPKAKGEIQEVKQEVTTGDDGDKMKIKELEDKLAKNKQECNDMIASLKQQYDRDIKNLQKQNQAAIDKLQKQHQDTLKKLGAEHENVNAKLKEEMRKKETMAKRKPSKEEKKPEETKKKTSIVGEKKEKPKVEEKKEKPKVEETKEEPTIEEPKEEPKVEEKKEEPVKEEKASRLSQRTFYDVCICGKLPMVIPLAPADTQKPETQPCKAPCGRPEQYYAPQEQPQFPPCMLPPPCMTRLPALGYEAPRSPSPPADEKLTSIKKIVELENKLLVKQQHTKQKIDTLHQTVDKFKRELELERQRNSDLVSRYTNQSKTVANMKVEIDLVKQENFQDKRRLQQLNMTLKNIMEGGGGGGGAMCSCSNKMRSPVGIPHFRTELTSVERVRGESVNGSVLLKSGQRGLRSWSGSDNLDNVTTLEVEPVDPGKVEKLDELKSEKTKSIELEAELRMKGKRVEELEEEAKMYIGEIREYEDHVNQQENEINRLKLHIQSLSPDLEKKQLQKMKGDVDDQNRDVEHLQNRINNLQVMLALRDKSNAALTEKLNLEIDNKEKMKEMVKMMSDNYTNLLKQSKGEGHSCKCTKNKKKRKEMKVQLKEKNQRIQELENERQVLSKDIKECEEYITNQVDEMKKLASYIDRLTRDSEKRQEQKNIKGSTTTNHAKEKEESEESSAMRENAVNERLEELQTKVKEYEKALTKREDDNKALSENLENERRSKEKVEEAFTKTMKIYEDLLEKNEDNEMLRTECAMYKAQIDELKGLKATCEELRSKAQIVDELEKEKQGFIQEIRDCNFCMINQDDKISKLMNQIESTTEERDNRENEMKQTIMDMESQIVEYQQKLDNVQRELQETKIQFSGEKLLMKSQIQELETQIEDYELNMILKDENNKVLLDSLESEKLSRTRLERALESITTSDERLKEMLAQARHTIKCITQKLEEYDIERLEVQKDNQMKISELREQLMIANTIITKLRENLDQMKRIMDKNVALRTLSAQLHESAKIQVTELEDANRDLSKKSQQMTEMYDHLKQVLYEKDKTFEDLRNQLLGLRQQLDDEQKLRENTEMILADVKAAGDSELSELRNVIDLSTAEINRLHQEMDSLMKTSTAGRLKMQIEQLDKENAYLKEEIQKLTGCLEKILPGYMDPAELAKLRKQVSDLNSELERQKCEVENEKKMREEMVTTLHSKINQEKESDQRIRELMMENLSLRRSRVRSPSQQAVIFLEKQPKGGDDFEYSCLYGVKGGKTKPKAVKKSEKATEVPRLEELEKSKAGVEKRKKSKEVARVAKVEKSTEVPDLEKLEKPRTVARLEKIEKPKEVLEKPQESAALKEIIIANNAELTELKRQNKNLKDEIVSLKRKEAVKPVVPKEDEGFAKEREELSGQITNQKKEIASLLDKINRMPDVNKSLKELQQKKEENAKLKSIIADLDDKLKNLPQFQFDTPADAPEVDKVIVQLRKSLEWEQDRVRQLEEYWKASEKKNESLTVKNGELEAQITKVKSALTKLQDEKKKPSASAMYEAQIKEINNHLQNWEGQINGVVTHVKDEIQSITGKVGGQQIGEDHLQKLVNEVENLKKELLDNVLSKKRVALTSELQDKHIVEVEGQLRKSLENNEGLQRKIEGLEKALENVHKNLQVKSVAGRDSVVVKSSTDDMQLRQTTELQEQLRDCKRRNDNLKKEVERLHNQRMSIMSESFEFQTSGDSKRIKELEEQLHRTQEENESLRKKTDKLRTRSSDKSLTFLGDDPKNRRLRELEDTMERWQKNYEGEVWRLKKEIERLTSKGVAPGSDPAEGRSQEVEGYQKHNEYLEKRIAQLEADNERLNKLVEKLADTETEEFVEGEVEEKRIRDLVEHLRELQKKNETLKTRTIQLELENGRLRNDLERITGQEHKTFEKELQRLNELERQMARNQEKYQYLRKRTMKLEIENKNLKKEYIDTLIAKEKLSLLSHDQEKRLRETNKLLKKCQDKRQNLTKRMVHLQVETEQMKKEMDIGIGKELEEHIRRFEENNTASKIRIAELEAENDYLKRRMQRQSDARLSILESESVINAKAAAVEDTLKKSKIDENLKIKVIQLEMENEQMKKELEGMKVKDVASVESDLPEKITVEDGTDTNERLQMRAVELEIENEYLKSELSTKEKMTMESGMTINRVAELEEEVQNLTAKIEQLKVKNVELELDNEYLKNEIERISKVQESMQPDLADKDTEKQNHMLKMKNDHLEIENKNLKIQLENMGNEQVSLEAHVQDKRLKEIERLLRQFHDYKDTLVKDFRKKKSKEDVSAGELDEVEERLKKWREQFEPEILNLKKDLDRLMSREKGESSGQVQKLEGQLRESKTKIDKLETENRNMKIELDIIRKGRPSEAKLAKEVEQIMKEAAEIAKRSSSGGGKDLETRFKECQNTNETLRKEKVALERHVQDKKIKELEAQIREYQIYDFPKVDPQRRREKKSIVIDVQEMKVKELEAQLKDCQINKESLKGDFEKLRKEKLTIQKDLEMKLQDCKSKNEELNTEVERFRKINDLQTKLTNDLEKKLIDCRNKNEGLEATLAKMPKDRKVSFLNLHEEHQNAQERISELEEQLEKCRHINRKLKKEIAMRDEEKLGRSNQQQEEDKKSEDNDDKTSGPSDDESGTSEGHKGVQGRKMLREVERRLVESQVANANLKQELGDLRAEKTVLQDKMKKMNEMAERLRAAQTNYRGVKRELERLRKEKESVRDKRSDKKVWELEKQVREGKNRSETLKGEVERLSKELVAKSVVEDENKTLKNEVNRLTQELLSREQDIEGLKDEIDKQRLVKDELLRQMDSQQSEISKLHAKIKLLGGGEEVSSVFDELENKNREVEKLKVTIADLERHVEDLRKQRPEVGKGDTEERRSRKLEATLQKYQDNNESLKMQIVRLETEKTNLKVELNAHIDKEKKSPGSETQVRHVRKLEEILQRYQDNNESLKKKIAHLEADYQEKRVRELEEQVQKCQVNNDNLKLVTVQLEFEIKYLKKELETFVEREKGKVERMEERDDVSIVRTIQNEYETTLDVDNKSKRSERELGHRRKEAWKNIISRLKKKYKEDVRLLQEQNEEVVDLEDKKQDESSSTEKISTAAKSVGTDSVQVMPQQSLIAAPVQQPFVQFPYTTMPWLLQQPVWTYANYVPMPQTSVATTEQVDLQQLSLLIDRIQNTVDKSKLMLELEKEKSRFLSQFDEEKEQRSFDFSTQDELQRISDAEPNATLFNDQQDDEVSPRAIFQLNQQLLKQQETKEKIDVLQTTIRDTMRELEKESQRQGSFVCRQFNPSFDNVNRSLPSTSHEHSKEAMFGQQKFKNVVSKCSHLSGSVYTIPHFHAGPSSERTDKKRSRVSFLCKHSSHNAAGGSFDSFEK